MSACNVTFWKDKDFEGHYKNYDGAQKVPDLNKVQWHDQSHDDMKDDIGSIQTSTQTWVRVYSKANYQGRTALIGPNSNVNMEDLMDDNGEDNMDDTIESFQLFDRKPTVNSTNIINNFIKLYPGSVHSRKDNVYNSEFYAQDSEFRIYDPIIVIDDTNGKVDFTINLDHVQVEKDDHAVVTFSMDYHGNFANQITVTYTMADASQIPDWLIKIIDGAIDVAADAAKIIADGAEIVVTDGVGIVATVETDKLIDYTAKAITFCVDHLNTVLNAIFTYQDDGGTMYFPAVVSHSISRCVLAYYQELYGPDQNTVKTFKDSNFLTSIGVSNWDNSKHNPYVEFNQGSYSYRSYYPDNTFFYAKGGSLSSVKIDAITGLQKDDHLIMQAVFDPKGDLFSIIGSVDLFSRSHSDNYKAPTSGLLTYNDQGQMIHISQDKTVTTVNYSSLTAAYQDKMTKALDDTASSNSITINDQQYGLVAASLKVLTATEAGM